MKRFSLTTSCREEIIDITTLINEFLKQNKHASGAITVYSPHTTAGITVNENADPDVKKDLVGFLKKLIPQDAGFAHMEGNSDAHIKGTLTGFSQTFIVEDCRVQLGTWQGIFFAEYDGPRQREIWIQFHQA